MSRINLTDDYVRKTRQPRTGQAFHRDAVVRGFALRITAAGARSWVVELARQGGSIRRTLDIPVNVKRPAVDEARKAAQELIVAIRQDRDPLVAKREQKAVEAARADAPTFKALLDEYVADLKRRGRSSAVEARQLFAKNVLKAYPHESELPAADITAGHITAILRRLVKAGYGRSASKLRAYLVAAFQHAATAAHDATSDGGRDFGITSNPARLTKAMPQFNKARERKLTPEEFEAVLRDLWNDERDAAKAALLTALLGGQRIIELERALAADFNERGDPATLNLYVKKGRNAKRRPHIVPVIGPAIPIVKAFAASAKTARRELLLPASVPEMRAVIREISAKLEGEPFVLHDLRAACETQLVALGVVSKEIRGRLLAHGVHGVQDAHYDAHSYLPEKTDALRKLHAWMKKVVAAEKVVA